MFRSAALRLTVFNALVIFIILALALTTTYVVVSFATNNRQGNHLQQSAERLQSSESFRETFRGASLLYVQRVDAEEAALFPILPALWFDASGRYIGITNIDSDEDSDELEHMREEFYRGDGGDRPPFDFAPGAVNSAIDGARSTTTVQTDDDWWKLSTIPILRSSQVIGVVQILMSVNDDVRLLLMLRWSLLGVGLTGIVAATAGGFVLAQRALHPLQEAFRRQSEFIRDASHQLRTPITVIRADAEALSRSLPDLGKGDAQLLEDLTIETEIMGNLIQQLIAGARITGNDNRQHRVPVPMATLVDSIVAAITPLAAQRSISVKAQNTLKADDSVLGAPLQLRLALMGVLDNAVRYGKEGGIVELAAMSDGRNVVVTIRDNGLGIPRQEIGSVFDRFYRGSVARGQATDGAGLGLSIAREIARLCGGDITLVSEQDVGTTVTTILPQT